MVFQVVRKCVVSFLLQNCNNLLVTQGIKYGNHFIALDIVTQTEAYIRCMISSFA